MLPNYFFYYKITSSITTVLERIQLFSGTQNKERHQTKNIILSKVLLWKPSVEMLKVSKVSSIRKHCQKSTTICSHNLIFHVDGWAVWVFFFLTDEYAAMGKSKSKSYLIRPHGKLKNKVFCLTDMGTLFQYARRRGRHSKLASCIYLGLLLWFSAGTGLGIKLLVCTKWKCLPDPSLFSGCPMRQGWLERVTVLAWMAPFLWKNWDNVLEGGPSELKEA